MNNRDIEILGRLDTIQIYAKKIWQKKHYKWANEINWQVMRIKELIKEKEQTNGKEA